MSGKDMFQKIELILKKLKEELIKVYKDNLISIVIFGSIARKTFVSVSDLDVLILCKSLPKGRIRRLKKFEKIEEKIESFAEKLGIDNLQINPIITTFEGIRENPLLLDIIRHSIILYDRNKAFSTYLSLLKKRVENNVVFCGEYWITKNNKPFDEVLRI